MIKLILLCSPELGEYLSYWLNDKVPTYRVNKNPLSLCGFWEITIYRLSPDDYSKLYDFIEYHKRKGDLL